MRRISLSTAVHAHPYARARIHERDSVREWIMRRNVFFFFKREINRIYTKFLIITILSGYNSLV